MTQDYKDTLLEYLTDNLEEDTPPIDIPEFSLLSTKSSDIYTDLETAFPYGYIERGILKCKDGNGEYNGKTLIYGYYYTDAQQTLSLVQGYLVLLDENYNILEIIKNFTSGTLIRRLMAMNIDEKGQLYGIDFQGSDRRIILCNNVSIKSESAEHYTLKLRISYSLQGSAYSLVNLTRYVFKDENSASYYIHRSNGTGTSLKINVGSTNDWQDYTYNSIPNTQSTLLITIKPFWDSNNNLTVYEISQTEILDSGQTKKVVDLGVSDENFIIQHSNLGEWQESIFGLMPLDEVHLLDLSMSSSKSRGLNSTSGIIISPTKFYITACCHAQKSMLQTNKRIIVQTTLYDSGTFSQVAAKEYSTTVDYEHVEAYTETIYINNTLFTLDYINPDTSISYPIFTIYVKYINLSSVIYSNSYLGIGSTLSSQLRTFNIVDISNIYNLYKVHALLYDFDLGDYMLSTTNLIYNSNNYNGEEYKSTNMLVPKQVWLYDENDEIIFARNLYNKVIYNNITESTLEVPNTMLNNEIINTQKLIGATNYVLNVNEDNIEKNIYETLYINFFNTLLIQNRNTLDYITNYNGSSRLNRSVSDLADYDNAKITKFRVNYTNGTSLVKNIISSTITNGIADIQFQLTVISDILNIELISNDEETTYQTITDFTSYDIGKTYILSQKCYVE